MSPNEPEQIADFILLQQLKDGSAQAFNILFEKYWEVAYSNAYKRLKSEDDAKDIVQEIFTYLWMNREKLHIENLPAYLYVAVRNKVIKLAARQKNVDHFFNFLENIPEKSSRADGQILWKEFLKSYEALVAMLPTSRQEIFRLRFQEGLSTKVISMQLKISRKTVQNQLGKAIDSLRISFTHMILFIFFIHL